jgi:hypothetical protein
VASVLVVGVGVVAYGRSRDGSTTVQVGGQPVTTTTAPSATSTTATTPTTVPAGPAIAGIWPFATREAMAEAPDDRYDDPVATALAFAREQLHLPDPVVAGDPQTDGLVVSVPVLPEPGSPLVTTVVLQRASPEPGPCTVIGATTPDLVLERHDLIPQPDGTVKLEVSGRSLAFEAVVSLDARSRLHPGAVLAHGTVMGGGTELAPFDGSLAFAAPEPGDGVVVVLYVLSAKDGSVSQATVALAGPGSGGS